MNEKNENYKGGMSVVDKNHKWTVDRFREALTELSRKNKKYLEKIEALNKENKQLRIKIVTHLKEYLKVDWGDECDG